MPSVADSAMLNVQPRERRSVYEALAKVPEGRSVKELLDEVEMPETNLRQSLRKLGEAGLAMRAGRLWTAVQLEGASPPSAPEQAVAEPAT
jgi:DNA-binding transcriptional ArsR family regulator